MARRKVRARRRKNPGSKSRPILIFSRKAKRTRKNGKRYFGRKVRVNRKRRHCTRRNPFSVKSLMSKNNLMQAGTIGGGIVGGAFAMPLIYSIVPAAYRGKVDKYLGGVHVLLGILLYTMAKSRAVKQIGAVISGTGVYDLVASNVSALNLPSLPRQNSLLSSALPAPATPVAGFLGNGGELVASEALASSYERGEGLASSYETIGEDDSPYSEIDF